MNDHDRNGQEVMQPAGPGGRAALIVPALVLLSTGIILFLSSGRDDAHITYFAAEALSRTGEVLNYSGERLEQSSTLLMVLILAFISRLTGLAAAAIGPPVSAAAGCAAVILTGRAVPGGQTRPRWTAALFVATFTPFVYWSFSGMEAALAGLLAIMLIGAYGKFMSEEGWAGITGASLVTLLFFLARPESVFITGGMLFLMLSALYPASSGKSQPVGRIVCLLLINLAAFAVITAGRLFYFGSLFPQPVGAKVGRDIPGAVSSGLLYLARTVAAAPSTILVIIAVIFASARAWSMARGRESVRVELLVPASFVIMSFLFVITSGGDWMEGGRFFVPMAPAAGLLLAEMQKRLVKVRGMSSAAGFIAGVLAVQLFSTFIFAYGAHPATWAGASTGRPLWTWGRLSRALRESGVQADRYPVFDLMNRVHLRDVPAAEFMSHVVADLRRAGLPEVRIMSHQSGLVMYYTAARHGGGLEFTDLMGLASAEVTGCAPLIDLFPGKNEGIRVPLDFVLGNMEVLSADCGFTRPDVVFELGFDEMTEKVLKEEGYRVVYAQSGPIGTHSWMKGAPVSAEQFIAVREELVPLLSMRPMRYSWSF